ncbi:DNA circularization N-terminal domain-containing protein [Mesorhizobium sp. 2RAF21]|uniref:DNA circularization N-terminal domain-containing protein n=1 Tax=Mesorhizobium sp. 2RAF21 TaxID=3232995 RepID=UPI003F95771B
MIIDSVAHVLPGCLPASYRGIGFFVPDTSTEAGRRVAESLFPGTDRAAYDDLGLRPAVISLEGLMVGDDYVAQARDLQAQFERPGPGTLIHPWLGAMTVILEEPAEISFSASELRVARFHVSFKRVRAGFNGLFQSTAATLLGAALNFASAIMALGSSPASQTISRVQDLATQRSTRLLKSEWLALPAGSAAAVVRSALPQSVPAGPVAFTSAVMAVTDTVVRQLPGNQASAVAPAAEAPVSTASVTPAQLVDLFAAAALRFTDEQADAPSAADGVLLLTAAGDPLGKAAALSVQVEHANREDAQILRARLTGAIDNFTDALAAIDDIHFAAVTTAASRAASALRAAVIADINEAIGRLPALIVRTYDTETDAYAVANDLYGDRPEAIEAGYRSLVERNRPRHPAMLPAGRIEALK